MRTFAGVVLAESEALGSAICTRKCSLMFVMAAIEEKTTLSYCSTIKSFSIANAQLRVMLCCTHSSSS
jgi:hypothetical protein